MLPVVLSIPRLVGTSLQSLTLLSHSAPLCLSLIQSYLFRTHPNPIQSHLELTASANKTLFANKVIVTGFKVFHVLFTCLLATYMYIFFGEMSIQILCQFLTELSIFLFLSCKNFSYILDLYQIFDLYFLPFCELSFHFLIVLFETQKGLTLMKFSLAIFPFVTWALV